MSAYFLIILLHIIGLGLSAAFQPVCARKAHSGGSTMGVKTKCTSYFPMATATARIYAHSAALGNILGGDGDVDPKDDNQEDKVGRVCNEENIDLCEDGACEDLYEQDRSGQGSTGGFLLLDRRSPAPAPAPAPALASATTDIDDSNSNSNSSSSSNDDEDEEGLYNFSQTSVAVLRKRFGSRKTLWGEWSNEETRAFYKQQLPRSLLEDGALSLTLKERAQLAAEARHALRLYARERQKLPGRVLARASAGLSHLKEFGYWSSEGMSWDELVLKYSAEARTALGPGPSPAEIETFCYTRIVERSCVTNSAIDKIAEEGLASILKAKIASQTESFKKKGKKGKPRSGYITTNGKGNSKDKEKEQPTEMKEQQ